VGRKEGAGRYTRSSFVRLKEEHLFLNSQLKNFDALRSDLENIKYTSLPVRTGKSKATR
jgi:hypothetical protein